VNRMLNRRLEARMFCADIVEVRWQDPKTGHTRQAMANLDDISPRGASLGVDYIIAAKTPVRIIHSEGELTGKVIYCLWQDVGFVIGVEFDPDCRWSQDNYRPQYLSDPPLE
jgi:hypothetical protein